MVVVGVKERSSKVGLEPTVSCMRGKDIDDGRDGPDKKGLEETFGYCVQRLRDVQDVQRTTSGDDAN